MHHRPYAGLQIARSQLPADQFEVSGSVYESNDCLVGIHCLNANCIHFVSRRLGKRTNQRRRQVGNGKRNDAQIRIVADSLRKQSWLQRDGRGAKYIFVGVIVYFTGADQRTATVGVGNELKRFVDEPALFWWREAPRRSGMRRGSGGVHPA